MGIKKALRSVPFIKTFLQKRAIRRKTDELKPYLVDLQRKNIQNLRMLLNRDELLKELPKNAIVVEIGVDTGKFSQAILDITTPSQLHLIDAWSSDRYNYSKEIEVRQKFSLEIESGLVILNKGYSTHVLPSFPDDYFDWVYLDSGHGFKLTMNELEILRQKIKRNGIIAGHDYCRFSAAGGSRFGVVEAVNWFCIQYNFEFLYLTMETHRHLSFAIRRIIE